MNPQITVEPYMIERVAPSHKNVFTGERHPEQRWQEQKGWEGRRSSLRAWSMDRDHAVHMLGLMEGARRSNKEQR